MPVNINKDGVLFDEEGNKVFPLTTDEQVVTGNDGTTLKESLIEFKKYVDDSIQQAIYDSWEGEY